MRNTAKGKTQLCELRGLEHTQTQTSTITRNLPALNLTLRVVASMPSLTFEIKMFLPQLNALSGSGYANSGG